MENDKPPIEGEIFKDLLDQWNSNKKSYPAMIEESKCTCKEFSKQRALCPVCDKETFDEHQKLIWGDLMKNL